MYEETAEAEPQQAISLVPETASDRAVRFLRAMIFSGELGPGDRLPPERDLGANLGISRMTLRLALKALESTGYIVTTRGSRGGSRVADSGSLLECWRQWMRQHHQELDDIIEFRMTVETRLAALAAERRTERDLETIAKAAERERKPQEWPSLFRTDMDIHRMIARAARSPRLEQAMMAARADLFTPVNLARLEEREHTIHDSHLEILAAIRDRESDKAAELMREHIEIVKGLMKRALVSESIVPG